MIKPEEYAGWFLYDPPRSAKQWQEYEDELREYPGHRWFSPMDKITKRIRRTDLIVIVARPGNGKTTLGLAQARAMGMAIQAGLVPNYENTAVVYATVEQTVEDAEVILQASPQYPTDKLIEGQVPPDVAEIMAVERGALPLWLIGRSRQHFGKKQPPLDAEAIMQSIYYMMDKYEKQVHVLFVDYLQYLPSADMGTRGTRTQVTEAVIREIKDLTTTFGIPVILTAQARREVDDRKVKIGTMRDIQHTSFAEQTVDRFFYFHRPILDKSLKDNIYYHVGDKSYDLDDYLMIIAQDKGRLEKIDPMVAVRFHPATLEFDDAQPRDLLDVNSDEAYRLPRPSQLGMFKNVDPIDV